MTPSPGRWSLRCFVSLLRLYPAWFRHEHADEMVQLFQTRFARVRGWRSRSAFWGRILADTANTAWKLRRPTRQTGAERTGQGGLNMWMQDVQFGSRYLWRTPLFTIGAVCLLAVGLAANIAVFSLTDRLLLRPLPYADAAQVVHILQDDDDGEPSTAAFPA